MLYSLIPLKYPLTSSARLSYFLYLKILSNEPHQNAILFSNPYLRVLSCRLDIDFGAKKRTLLRYRFVKKSSLFMGFKKGNSIDRASSLGLKVVCQNPVGWTQSVGWGEFVRTQDQFNFKIHVFNKWQMTLDHDSWRCIDIKLSTSSVLIEVLISENGIQCQWD